MSQKKLYTFWLDEELRHALKQVKDADGIPESVQLRDALRRYMRRRGVPLTTAASLVAPRQREAITRFAATIDAAVSAGTGAKNVIVPKALGKTRGGGKRFGDLTRAEAQALCELNHAIDREATARGRVLASIVKEVGGPVTRALRSAPRDGAAAGSARIRRVNSRASRRSV